MKLFRRYLPVVLVLLQLTASAQSYTLSGSVTDTLNANRLPNASVTLIRAADSILETFGRTGQDGRFLLQTPNPGDYLIMITFPGFADFIDKVAVGGTTTIELGTIPMITKSHLLSEFVLKQQLGAIKIKGDTTEYMADSFLVRENATVEELLRKLPGLQVSKTGEVTAQGEKVQKILVDGEEFFTDDPAVVTKNLQAKTVESVQVYDKKSDQAIFTGIDDGIREKTINLKLKENMKKGFFGKVVAGGGTDGYFENQGMLNAFKGKRKISVFGIMANTGRVGLGWQDADRFGAGGDGRTTVVQDGEIITYSTADEDGGFGGRYNGRGLPAAWTGGLHYSNKWLEDKLHLSSNYRFARQHVETVNNNINEMNLADTRIYTSDNNAGFQSRDRHRADALFEWNRDSTSRLKLTANSGHIHNISKTAGIQETRTETGATLNDNHTSQNNDELSRYVNANLDWQKKLAKKGRTLSVSIEEQYRETSGNNHIASTLNYYNQGIPGLVDSTTINNQQKDNYTENFRLTGRASYTEPLSKILFLELNYAATINNSNSRRYSYEKSATGYFDSLNHLFSSNYDFNIFTHTGGSNLRFVYKKFNFSVGGAVSSTQFVQQDLLNNSYSHTRQFTNFFPRASFSFRPPGKQTSFSVRYNGSTAQPSIEQIQPLRQNTDLLNEAIGNPSLRQKFTHNISANYNDYKVFTSVYRYAGVGMNVVDDDISRAETINAGGKRIYQYVNIDGNYSGWAYGGFGKDLRKLNLRVGVNLNANISRRNNIVNGQKNRSDNNSYGVGLNINYDKEKLLDIYYGPSINYNSNNSTINTTVTNYWSFNQDLNVSVQLPLKFEIGTEIEWYIRQQVTAFDRNNDVFRWNAWVGKKFLKSDALELRASVFDILNQNIGFQRYGYGNTVSEQNYNTIQRYGMLSLIWNFTKTITGKENGKEEEDNGIIIIE